MVGLGGLEPPTSPLSGLRSLVPREGLAMLNHTAAYIFIETSCPCSLHEVRLRRADLTGRAPRRRESEARDQMLQASIPPRKQMLRGRHRSKPSAKGSVVPKGVETPSRSLRVQEEIRPDHPHRLCPTDPRPRASSSRHFPSLLRS